LAFGLIATMLAGCGGSGGGGSTSTQTARVQIQWSARSRAVTGPASALSATITLANATPTGGNLSLLVNRRAQPPEAYTDTYLLGQAARGTHNLTVRFYAGPDATGAVVAEATGTLNDGGVATVTTESTIKSVTVTPGQGVPAGMVADLGFSARDENGALVAITPGSAFWTVTGGSSFLQVDADGTATGLARGIAQVRATVDGVASDPTDVKVDADPMGPTTTLSFDDLPGVSSEAGTAVTPDARLADQYRASHGIAFSSGSPYAAVVQMRSGEAPSGANALSGVAPDGTVAYAQANPITFTFFDPLAPQAKGRTRSFSLTTDRIGSPGQAIRIEAYDAAGNLIGSDEKSDEGGQTLTVSFDTPRIHRVVFLGAVSDVDGVAVDDVTFAPVIPAETP
jgi:hypothetical protein